MLGRVTLTIPAAPSAAAIAEAVGAQFAAEASVPPAGTEQLQQAIRCLVEFSYTQSYEHSGGGDIEISLELDDRGVQLDVHDWGRPFRRAGGPDGPLPPGLEGVLAIDPDARLINLANDGKRLSACITTEHGVLVTPVVDGDAARVQRARGSIDDVEVRDATIDDATAIARLLYDNYGLNYVHRHMYSPVWIEEAMRDGRVMSTVAYMGDELIGHHAYLVDAPGQAAETGVAVVARAWRGLGLFDAMFVQTMARAVAHGIPALFARATTSHVYSQRSEFTHGYAPIALELGAAPASMAAGQSDSGEAASGRSAILYTAKPLTATAQRAARVPARYGDVIGRLALESGIEFVDPDGTLPLDLSQEIEFADDEGNAYVRVSGEGDHDRLERMLWSEAARQAGTIYADIDMSCAGDSMLDVLLEQGFFLCGFRHFGHGGREWLRLQRPQVPADLDNIQLEGETANWLLAQVLADRGDVS